MKIKKSELQKLIKVIKEGNLSINQAIKLIVGNNKTKEEINKRLLDVKFTITVDYRRSLAEMLIASGLGENFDPNITEENFPIPDGLKGKEVSITAKLSLFSYDDSNKNLITETNENVFRQGSLFEQLALLEGFPDLQKQVHIPIVALGSVWSDESGNNNVPALVFHGNECFLDLLWINSKLLNSYAFLTVFK